MKKYLLVYLCIFLFPVVTQASILSFEEEYIYDASEADSKITCRAISLLQVKRLLLERLGTYLEAKTEIVNHQLTKDEIVTLSAGIVKTEILREKWNGKTYSLTARIEADPNGVAKAINELKRAGKGEEKIKQLETINDKSIEKIQELKKELARVQENLIIINRDFTKSAKIINSWESFETGLDLLNRGKYKKAISAFDTSIEQNPKYMHFFQRGIAYMKIKQYHNAIKDFSATINIKPRAKNAYFQRGLSYRKMGKKKKGLKDIKKAAKLGSGNAKRWLKAKGYKKRINKY
ncbi:MAG: hypothetical protein SWH54_14500 [Thermodesulfobacteriota bacterium]|nr:hypothetical protein [Thermodesulfobacteriota bacterium]